MIDPRVAAVVVGAFILQFNVRIAVAQLATVDAAQGGCTPGACDDGNPCNGMEYCTPSGGCVSGPAEGRFTEIEVLLPPIVPPSSSAYGSAVAIDGNVLVVGDRADNETEVLSGAAYVFRFDGSQWQFEAKLKSSTPLFRDAFGSSVAVRGNLILIGARADNTRAGSAYVFRFDGATWNEEAELLPPDGAAGDRFGSSVALGSNFAVIGAPEHSTAEFGTDSGAAYAYDELGGSWSISSKLIAPAARGEPFAAMGVSVAASATHIAVGSFFGESPQGDPTGSVTTYVRPTGTWQIEEYLSPDTSRSAEFGASLAMIDGRLLVGAPDLYPNPRQGGAFIYDFNGASWDLQGDLMDMAADGFRDAGGSVALWGNIAVVGAPVTDVPGSFLSGLVYVFRNTDGNWSQQDVFPADTGNSDRFGTAVAAYGKTIVVGEDQASVRGTAYTFEVAVPCDDRLPCTQEFCDLSGCSYAQIVGCGDLNCDGFASISDIGAFVLAITNPAGYDAQFPDCEILGADCSGDGLVTISDISCFVALLVP